MTEQWECEYLKIQAEIKAEEMIADITKVAEGIALRIAAENPEISQKMREHLSAWFSGQCATKRSIQ